MAGKTETPHRRLGAVWGAVLLIFVSQRIGDAINAFAGIWLVPHYIPQAELGKVLPLARAATLLALPLMVLLTPFTKLLGVHAERGELGKVKALVRDASLAAVVVFLATLAATPFFFDAIFSAYGIENGNLALAIVGCAVASAVAPVFTAVLQGLQRFRLQSFLNLATAPLRLAVFLVALPFRGLTGYFVGQASGPIFTGATALFDFCRRIGRKVRCEPYWKSDKAVFLAFGIPLAAYLAASNLRGFTESALLPGLPEIESAAFYQLTRFTEIASYLGASVSFVIFPVVSVRAERGEETRRLLAQAEFFTVVGGIAFSVALAIFGPWIFGSAGFLRDYVGFTHLLLPLGLSATLDVSTACVAAHESARGRFRYAWALVVCELAETAFLALFAFGLIARGRLLGSLAGFTGIVFAFSALRFVVALWAARRSGVSNPVGGRKVAHVSTGSI